MDDIGGEGHKAEFQHLLRLGTLTLRRVPKMMQAFAVEHDVRREEWVFEAGILSEQFFCPATQIPIGLVRTAQIIAPCHDCRLACQ